MAVYVENQKIGKVFGGMVRMCGSQQFPLVPGMVEHLEKEDVITIQRSNCGLTQHLTQYSLLTINALHDGLTQHLTQEIEGIKKKDNLKKKYNKKESSENILSISSSCRQSTAPAKRFTPPTAEKVQQYLDSNGIVARCWALIIIHAIKKQTPCKESMKSLQGVDRFLARSCPSPCKESAHSVL